MKAKILVYALPALIVATIHLAEAQQPKKVPRIGLIAFRASAADRWSQQPFLEGLRDLGWVEGQNIAIERRYANANPTSLPDAAADLVRLKVDVIVVRDSVGIPL
jgi:putative ABC transport system substrate-binding protein